MYFIVLLPQLVAKSIDCQVAQDLSEELWGAASAVVAATCALCNHLNSYCTFLATHKHTYTE